MLSIQEAIQKVNREKTQAEHELEGSRTKAKETEVLLEFFAKSFTEFVKQIVQNKYAVDIKNLPSVQDVKGKVSVEGLPSLLLAIKELELSTKRNKVTFPDTQTIQGKVEVTNQKEVKFPDYPKEIKSEITSLPKYVGEKLDKVAEEIKKIELSPKITVEKDTPKVEIDLEGVKKLLEEISERLNLLEINPTIEIDVDGLKESTNEVKKAINNLKFPVPNFQSSWSHSLSMRSEDLEKTYAWTTDGGKDVIESITVRDEDGGTYRRTYTYDGSAKVIAETKWTRV
jgi:hypothetical protein